MDELLLPAQRLFGAAWPTVWTLAKIIAITVPLILCVAYLTLVERKVIGWMQVRIGPNRVGPLGLLQPFADVFKLLFKEIVVPTGASRTLFFVAPVLSIGPALAAWAVIPFDDGLVLANVNAGLLYILAMTSVGVYGVILAGWASNSKYAFLGCLRSAAQIVSYEIAMGFALVGVLMAASSLNISDIVRNQSGGLSHWYIWPLFPLFVVYLVSGIAETNRHPFDVAEGESEIVAGFHVEYSGVTFAVFFLAEYMNMATQSAIAVTLFLGGPAGPLPPFVPELIGGLFWFLFKVTLFLLGYIWLRAALPRLRYDQLMDLAWKVGIPVGLLWLAVSATYRVAQDKNWPTWVYLAAPVGAAAVYGILYFSMPNRPGAGGPGIEVFPDRREVPSE